MYSGSSLQFLILGDNVIVEFLQSSLDVSLAKIGIQELHLGELNVLLFHLVADSSPSNTIGLIRVSNGLKTKLIKSSQVSY